MWIPVFNKTVPKWLFKIHFLVFEQKETESRENPGYFANSRDYWATKNSTEKKYPVNSMCPVGQVLLEFDSSWTDGRVEVFCPGCTHIIYNKLLRALSFT